MRHQELELQNVHATNTETSDGTTILKSAKRSMQMRMKLDFPEYCRRATGKGTPPILDMELNFLVIGTIQPKKTLPPEQPYRA